MLPHVSSRSRPRCRSSSFLSTTRVPIAAVRAPPALDEAVRPWAAFRLTHPDPSVSPRSLQLDPAVGTCDVAAWLRHAADRATTEWSLDVSRQIIHGHRGDGGLRSSADGHAPRFSYLALPHVGEHRAGAIARGMIVASSELTAQLAWVRERMVDVAVSWRAQPQVVLRPVERGDPVVARYVGASARWATVTPVVLPGHHDGSATKAERLMRRAFLHAGVPAAYVDRIRRLEWRLDGFYRGLGRADAYRLPDTIQGPRFHVLVEFDRPIVGPLVIGSGRHRGLGLFVRAGAR